MVRFCFITILTSILSFSVYAQVTPFEVLPHIMRGINLGNTFETDSVEGHWKEEDPIEWKDNGPTQEYFFDAYTQAGFTCVRIPVTWHTRTMETSPFLINAQWINRVEEVIDWALQHDLYVIVNAHHETWLKENYSNQLYQERFDSIWSQIATRFKDKPDKLMFEIINEPLGLTVTEVDDLNSRILQIIRKTNPNRIVLFSGNKWSNVDELRLAAIPQDSYIMGYYHSYEPWSFAGEGQGTWGTSSDIAAMVSRIAKGKAWVDEHNIPLVISEFGTDTLCDYNSRMLFYAYYVEEAYKQGLAFMVWDDGGTFNVYRRNQQTWHDTKEILIYYSQLCPTNLILSTFNNTVQIQWANRIAADSMYIEYRTTNTQFSTLDTVTGDMSTYTHFSVIPEEFHYYRIKAFKNDSIYYSYSQRILVAPIESQRQPYTSQVISIPATFQAEHFDVGGYGLTYYDVDFVQSHSNYRTEKGVDILQSENNSYALINNQKGEWYEYSVMVPSTAEYEVIVYIGAVTTGGFSVQSNGVTKSKTCSVSGSYTAVLPHTLTMQLVEGNQILRLNITKTGDFAIDSIVIKLKTNVSITPMGGLQAFEIIHNLDNTYTLNTPNFIDRDGSLSIISLQGILVKQYNNVSQSFTFSMGQLPPGLYFVKYMQHLGYIIVR